MSSEIELAPFYNYNQDRGYYRPTLEEFNKTRTEQGLDSVTSFDDPKGKAKPFSPEKEAMLIAIRDYLVSEGWESPYYSPGDWYHPQQTSGIAHDILDVLSIQVRLELP